jgi:hypothetical protein
VAYAANALSVVMGWSRNTMLGRFLELFERKSDAYDALLGIGMQTAANIAVTPELALKSTPVYPGVSIPRRSARLAPVHAVRAPRQRRQAGQQ